MIQHGQLLFFLFNRPISRDYHGLGQLCQRPWKKNGEAGFFYQAGCPSVTQPTLQKHRAGLKSSFLIRRSPPNRCRLSMEGLIHYGMKLTKCRLLLRFTGPTIINRNYVTGCDVFSSVPHNRKVELLSI